MNREQTKTERTEAFKNGKRIGYFDHRLKTLVLDEDNFINRQTWKEWRAFKKAHPGEGVSEFLFQCSISKQTYERRRSAERQDWGLLLSNVQGSTSEWLLLLFLDRHDRHYRHSFFRRRGTLGSLSTPTQAIVRDCAHGVGCGLKKLLRKPVFALSLSGELTLTARESHAQNNGW